MRSGACYSGEELLVLGQALLTQRKLNEAMEHLVAAELAGADPDRCDAALWMAHMLLGNFELAWRLSDAIRHRGAADPHRLWNGEDLTGKRVIVRCLHGYGDTVQFLRYAARLKKMSAEVVYEMAPRMVEIAKCFDGVEQAITWSASGPENLPEWDVQVEIMELPYVFRTQLADLPLSTRYLKLVNQPSRNFGPGRLRVGINCNAGDWNPERAISPHALYRLSGIEGAEFYDLRGFEPGALSAGRDLAEAWKFNQATQDSIEGLARAINEMDVVITVDTLTAHLAGALGIPCWIMLRHEADWRWMHERTDSPWYPSVRLFRQTRPGDWNSVVLQIYKALRDKIKMELRV